MTEKKENSSQPLGEYSVTFKARKKEEGDVLLREKKRYRPKGKALSGAAKMKAAYRKRMAKATGRK
ncbi:MAG: hypothetical protein R3Y38_00355 [Rikenellaceae bacterium]